MSPERGSRASMWSILAVLCGELLAACGTSSEPSDAERGRELFESKALSSSSLNDFTCQTCHDARATVPASKKPGAALAGVTARALFWGGQENELLRAVNDCRNYFMVDSRPLAATDADARSLYAYLESLGPGDGTSRAFTVVTDIDALPRGNAGPGFFLFAEACSSCHGVMHAGTGRLSARVPILPEETLLAHTDYTPRVQRLIFTEKIRHGLFLGYSGVMPPFSAELVSNQDVSDLLEALGVWGE